MERERFGPAVQNTWMTAKDFDITKARHPMTDAPCFQIWMIQPDGERESYGFSDTREGAEQEISEMRALQQSRAQHDAQIRAALQIRRRNSDNS